MREVLRNRVRPAALTIIAPIMGFLLIFVFEKSLKIEISKLLSSIINLLVVAPVAFILFPRWLGIPFGKIETREFLRKIGFYLPEHTWKHLVLGLILALCTLSGMFIASILTGRYTMNISTINLPQMVFSLNPALWEELFYRGVFVFLLMKFGRSLKTALVIQAVLFGVAHIKGADIGALVDAFSVIVLTVGFTYAAYKTRSLAAGIVFHYFHDAFLFFVQVPGGTYTGVAENVKFYGFLWLMTGIGCAITWLAADKFGIRTPTELYKIENT